MAAAAPATLMLAGDRRPLARGQRTDQAPADPRREPLIRHGGHLALVSELKRLVATVAMFLIAGTGSADGVPARHRGRRNRGLRQVAGELARALRCDRPMSWPGQGRDGNP